MAYQPSWVIKSQINLSRRTVTHNWEDEGFNTFPKGISPKVCVISWMELEFAYYVSSVQRFNHYNTKISPTMIDLYIYSLILHLSIVV